MNVRLLYLDDCPNWTELEERLREALDSCGVTVTIERCVVDTPEAADRYRFAGSPSILLDGRDPFPSVPGAIGLTCRLYATPYGPAGVPTLEQLVEAVREAAAR